MTTDRCIHRIAHNTESARAPERANERPRVAYEFSAVRSLPLSLLSFSLCSPSLFPITLPAAHPARSPCLPFFHLPTHPPRRKRTCTPALSARAAAPRSLIVHRNRNCVPASHAGRPLTFVRSAYRVSTLPSAPIARRRSLTDQPTRRFPLTVARRSARSTNRTVCLYRVGRA